MGRLNMTGSSSIIAQTLSPVYRLAAGADEITLACAIRITAPAFIEHGGVLPERRFVSHRYRGERVLLLLFGTPDR